MNSDISVVKERLKNYNEIFKLIGSELTKKSSEEEITLYGLDNFTYEKYLRLPEEYQDYIRLIIEKCLKLGNGYKFSKLVLKLDSNKFNGDVDRFFKYGEFLKKKIKDGRETKRNELVSKGKKYIKNIFKRKKSDEEDKKINYKDVKHYVIMVLIPVASIILFNTIKPLARQMGIVMSGLTNTFVYVTLGACAYKQIKYMIVKRIEKNKEDALLEKIEKKLGKEKNKEVNKENKVVITKEKEINDFQFDEEAEFEEFLNDEKMVEEDDEFSDIFEERKTKVEEEIEEDFLQDAGIDEDYLEKESAVFQLPRKKVEKYDDFLQGEEEINEDYLEKESVAFQLPRKKVEKYDDFLQGEEEINEDYLEKESVAFPLPRKKEEKYDDFFQGEEDIYGEHTKEVKKDIETLPIRSKETYDNFLQDDEELYDDSDNDSYFEIEEDEELETLPLNEETEKEQEDNVLVEDENIFNPRSEELITIKKIRSEIERTKLLKDELENRIKEKNNELIEFRKNSGKKHNELIKTNATYNKLYKEKIRMDSLYKEACNVFNYSLNTYYLISNGYEVTMNEYFSKLKENNGKKK